MHNPRPSPRAPLSERVQNNHLSYRSCPAPVVWKSEVAGVFGFGVQVVLKPFDTLYAQQNGASPLAEVAERLAAARPSDLASVDLSSYRGSLCPGIPGSMSSSAPVNGAIGCATRAGDLALNRLSSSEQALAVLSRSLALWNRCRFELTSDEVLAQVLDRGNMEDWRALYPLARSDAGLRARILHIILNVPLPLPRFWLAALSSLGRTSISALTCHHMGNV